MFIKQIHIKNFRIFPSESFFEINNLNIPDGEKEGSGLTIFVGENGCGKTSLLDALAFPYISYKADSFSLDDINNPSENTEINIYTNKDYSYKGTMPRVNLRGKGFCFTGGIRKRGRRDYLSSIIVTDQLFIRANGEIKPTDDSPDLRISVNNPWIGSRFNEIEFLILDKNRTYQTRKGTYNDTRFDRIMEDFNYQYIRKKNNPVDCNETLNVIRNLDNEGVTLNLAEAVRKFETITGNAIKLKFIDNWKPFSNAFLGIEKENLQTISLNQLGSGYEMIFSLIYSYFLSKKVNKSLIVLIDEPELHLHPKLQSDFVELLLQFSKDTQIILSTHSPLFVKQSMENKNVLIKVLNKTEDGVIVADPESNVLPYISANEINFVAFQLATEEYHNELYEQIKMKKGEGKSIKTFDNDYFVSEKLESRSFPWKGNANEVSIHTFLRNQIHHRVENGKANCENLLISIEKMREYITELNQYPF